MISFEAIMNFVFLMFTRVITILKKKVRGKSNQSPKSIQVLVSLMAEPRSSKS